MPAQDRVRRDRALAAQCAGLQPAEDGEDARPGHRLGGGLVPRGDRRAFLPASGTRRRSVRQTPCRFTVVPPRRPGPASQRGPARPHDGQVDQGHRVRRSPPWLSSHSRRRNVEPARRSSLR